MASHAMFPTAQRWKHHRTFLTFSLDSRQHLTMNLIAAA